MEKQNFIITKKDENKNKIRFRDLSLPLKLAVVGGMIYFLEVVVVFCIGFLVGLGVA